MRKARYECAHTNFYMEGDASFSVKFIDPEKVLAQTDMEPGAVVADFGCGAGYFSLAVARAIGSEGVVHSLDILPQRLESVASQAKNFGLTNIITQRANLEKAGGSKLPEKSVDWVVIKDMLFQNQDKKAIIKEAKRILKDDGKILLVEWNPQDGGIGPEKQLRLTEEAIVDLAQQEGLWVFKKINAGNFHYGLVLMK